MGVDIAYNEIVSFITTEIKPQQIIDFHPSEKTTNRVYELIDKEKREQLTSEEQSELEHYLLLEHLMRLAKAQAFIQLQKLS